MSISHSNPKHHQGNHEIVTLLTNANGTVSIRTERSSWTRNHHIRLQEYLTYLFREISPPGPDNPGSQRHIMLGICQSCCQPLSLRCTATAVLSIPARNVALRALSWFRVFLAGALSKYLIYLLRRLLFEKSCQVRSVEFSSGIQRPTAKCHSLYLVFSHVIWSSERRRTICMEIT